MLDIFGDPHLFFGRSLPFLVLSIITKNKTILCLGSFNYFAFTIHMVLNCYINTGVRDLEVAYLRLFLPEKNGINSKNILNRPIYAEINTQLRWNSSFYLMSLLIVMNPKSN